MSSEIAFEMVTASIRFGAGVTREVGMELVDNNLRRVMVRQRLQYSVLAKRA